MQPRARAEGPRWAPRVSRELLRRLYEADATGLTDDGLIDEVAFAFYARCESIRKATSAYLGRAPCADCGTEIEHRHRSAETLVCPNCTWSTTWADYRRTYQGKYLVTGNPEGAFAEYMRRIERARSPEEKMLAIDWMVHQVHSWTPSSEQPIGRPTAVSLIEGKETKVMEFLDDLASSQRLSSGSRYEDWRSRLYLASERGPRSETD
jgi:hypothetical protein